jgi:hypothetical protein
MTKIFSKFHAAVTFLWFFLLVAAKERTSKNKVIIVMFLMDHLGANIAMKFFFMLAPQNKI